IVRNISSASGTVAPRSDVHWGECGERGVAASRVDQWRRAQVPQLQLQGAYRAGSDAEEHGVRDGLNGISTGRRGYHQRQTKLSVCGEVDLDRRRLQESLSRRFVADQRRRVLLQLSGISDLLRP